MQNLNLHFKAVLVLVLATFSACRQHEDVSPTSSIGGSQDLQFDFYHLTPKVVDSNTKSLLIELRNRKAIDFVIKSSWGEDIPLYDDGTHGDKKASDGVYSCNINPENIFLRSQSHNTLRPYLGKLNLTEGFLSLFAEVWSDNIPMLAPTPINSYIQKTPHLVNIATDKISLNYIQSNIKTFYNNFSDDYDFIAIIYPGFNQNRYHSDVKMNIRGIGKQEMNMTSSFGSKGRLLGVNVFPNTGYFDGASVAYQHELGHQWTNSLKGSALEGGVPHWPLSDLASGIMGFSPKGGQGLQFPYSLIDQGNNSWKLQLNTAPPVFNDLELYLMGLASPVEVMPHIVFTNQDQVLQTDGLIYGPVTTVTIDNIITQFGSRQPNSTDSQKQFTVATIIVSDKLLSAEEMSFYDYFSARAELTQEVDVDEGYSRYKSKPFFLSTNQKGQIITTIK